MNPLKKAVHDYVALRRALGYQLRKAPARLLDFVDFLGAHHRDYITIPLALAWAQSHPPASPVEWAQRLICVRGFARYCSARDPRTQIPPPGLLPHRPQRAQPYLYSEAEIQALLKAARALGGLRGWTYYCLLGLLWVSGLRLSEALNLRPAEVDLNEGVLLISHTKFGKSRLVPLHPTTQKVLVAYGQQCERAGGPDRPYFLVSSRGHRLDPSQVRRTFHRLSRQVGLRAAGASHGPRLHDFRHRFALQTLLGWYRTGQEVQARLPLLSTYLGHVRLSDTYWYLSLCPQLRQWAVQRLEQHWPGLL